MKEQIMNEENVWLKTDEEKLRSLIADEAKNADMMMAMLNTLRQMQAKSKFRLALLNQLLEGLHDRQDNF
jgi:hypothetical protein